MKARATYHGHLAIAACLLALAACAPAPPTEEEGRAALERAMRAHFPRAPAIRITRFTKTNGQSMSAAGVALYQMYYSATIEFPQGLVPARGEFWGEFMAGAEMMGTLMMLATSGFKVVKGGKVTEPHVLEANFVLLFQRTERGWITS
jgi:hypothetical protein